MFFAQVLQVACGGMHTVTLTEDHAIYSWGVNDEGALGRETGQYSSWHCYVAYNCSFPCIQTQTLARSHSLISMQTASYLPPDPALCAARSPALQRASCGRRVATGRQTRETPTPPAQSPSLRAHPRSSSSQQASRSAPWLGRA